MESDTPFAAGWRRVSPRKRLKTAVWLCSDLVGTSSCSPPVREPVRQRLNNTGTTALDGVFIIFERGDTHPTRPQFKCRTHLHYVCLMNVSFEYDFASFSVNNLSEHFIRGAGARPPKIRTCQHTSGSVKAWPPNVFRSPLTTVYIDHQHGGGKLARIKHCGFPYGHIPCNILEDASTYQPHELTPINVTTSY